MHGVGRGVALQDLIESFGHSHPFSRGARRHVDQGEDIQLVSVWLRELRQSFGEAALFGLEPRTGVMCDKGNHAWRRILIHEPPRAVDWMESRGRYRFAVADVVNPSSHNESFRDIQAPRSEFLG
jgi:hypothetical protein